MKLIIIINFNNLFYLLKIIILTIIIFLKIMKSNDLIIKIKDNMEKK